MNLLHRMNGSPVFYGIMCFSFRETGKELNHPFKEMAIMKITIIILLSIILLFAVVETVINIFLNYNRNLEDSFLKKKIMKYKRKQAS